MSAQDEPANTTLRSNTAISAVKGEIVKSYEEVVLIDLGNDLPALLKELLEIAQEP